MPSYTCHIPTKTNTHSRILSVTNNDHLKNFNERIQLVNISLVCPFFPPACLFRGCYTAHRHLFFSHTRHCLQCLQRRNNPVAFIQGRAKMHAALRKKTLSGNRNNTIPNLYSNPGDQAFLRPPITIIIVLGCETFDNCIIASFRTGQRQLMFIKKSYIPYMLDVYVNVYD